MAEPHTRFQTLLRELFQFEHADLDFGVYRIMNMRRDRMEQWLTRDLPERAGEILRGAVPTADDTIAVQLQALRQQISQVAPNAIDPEGNLIDAAIRSGPIGQEYDRLLTQQRRAPLQSSADLEVLVYNHLYDFFSRYYDSGDFIAKRRRSFAPDGRDTYAVPWDGEEVVLHWANKDQYYIKTGERFSHYRWTATIPDRTFTIEFRLTDADLPANNNKDAKQKFHIPVEDMIEWDEQSSTLLIPFHYRELTADEKREIGGSKEATVRKNVIDRTVSRLQEHEALTALPHLATALMWPKRNAAGEVVTDKSGEPIPLLAHHLNRWAVRNESDFFIHKNLRRFLSGELDYYLKSVVLNIDNLLAAGQLRAEANFRLLEAIKKLGTEIIDFLAQLEDFQKGLFEKKKFIIETHWCITLDRIPDAVKDEAYEAILANDRQWEEWERLYRCSQWPADPNRPSIRTPGFLMTFPHLMIDTSLGYECDLIDRMLGEIPDVDAQIDGLLVQADNYQALRLLNARYAQAVKCVYIDPPYNSPNSEIAYKNSYRHSSFLSLLDSRLSTSIPLSTSDGSHVVAIDKNEGVNVQRLMKQLFIGYDLVAVTVEHNRKGVQDEHFSYTHEYALFAVPPARKALNETERPADQWEWSNFRNWGGESLRTDAANCFYPIFVRDHQIVGFGDVCDDDFHPASSNVHRDDGLIEIYPIDGNGIERKWRYQIGTVAGIQHLLKVEEDEGVLQVKIAKASDQFKTVWYAPKYNAGDHGTKLIRHLGLPAEQFDYPKSIHTVMDCVYAVSDSGDIIFDYFAGSGTTAHAVMQLNRNRGDSRKYVLVEMGEYWETLIKARCMKVPFAEKWRDGVPVSITGADAQGTFGGFSHVVKLLRLESYEDALDNIEFDFSSAPDGQMGMEFQRDYELRYALDWESRDCPTRLAVAALDRPFDYTLRLRRESGTVTVKPDLPETFAYLIGLRTRRRLTAERDGKRYLIYAGPLHADGTEVAVVWRTCADWDEAEYQNEKEWWNECGRRFAPLAQRVYVNAGCAIEGHVSTDAEFKRLMHPPSDSGV